ncbi:hypothetical protein Y032_0027g1565 [Ancylostoma ceylanicum]|uniref:Secreted protein n=1 Tax=Ancylostoma ceylanicum TaxID=53326 RepID=A0A016UVP0_9BILA|nr:hypothetical protein Y032_0027g1565 [Ancylostoma ceylanicum]
MESTWALLQTLGLFCARSIAFQNGILYGMTIHQTNQRNEEGLEDFHKSRKFFISCRIFCCESVNDQETEAKPRHGHYNDF